MPEQTQPQPSDINTVVTEIRDSWQQIRALPDQLSRVSQEVTDLRRTLLSRQAPVHPRQPFSISDDTARAYAAVVILNLARRDALELLSETASVRDSLLAQARQALGISQKVAVATADVPLPAEYGSEFAGLIADYGVARKAMTRYPIGHGTAKPARVGTRPAFGSIAMSAVVPEKVPTLTYASLESHKIGGIVRLPREIDEQTLIPMGRYLVEYGAHEFARIEDHWAFNADGTAGFEAVKGITQIATDNGFVLTTGAGKTHPSDITLAQIRQLRTLVNKALQSGRRGAYYMDTTWAAAIPGLIEAGDNMTMQRLPDGTLTIDGFPVIWTDVLQPYTTDAAAGKTPIIFAGLKFWWFGEHGRPRTETNDSVWFANDQLAVRFLEEIDFDYMANDAAAALTLAAA